MGPLEVLGSKKFSLPPPPQSRCGRHGTLLQPTMWPLNICFGQWIHGIEDPLAKPPPLPWFRQPPVLFPQHLTGCYCRAMLHCVQRGRSPSAWFYCSQGPISTAEPNPFHCLWGLLQHFPGTEDFSLSHHSVSVSGVADTMARDFQMCPRALDVQLSLNFGDGLTPLVNFEDLSL